MEVCILKINYRSAVRLTINFGGKVMIQKEKTTGIGGFSYYNDLAGNTRKVTHSVLLNDDLRENVENKIKEALWQLFVPKK